MTLSASSGQENTFVFNDFEADVLLQCTVDHGSLSAAIASSQGFSHHTGSLRRAGWLSGLSSAPRPPVGNAGAQAAATQEEAPSAPPAPSAPLLAQGNASTVASPKQQKHTDFDEDDGTCVVCMANPCEAGFLHGER